MKEKKRLFNMSIYALSTIKKSVSMSFQSTYLLLEKYRILMHILIAIEFYLKNRSK